MAVRNPTVGRTLVYLIDWIVVIAIGVAIIFLSDVTPKSRPFSLTNPSISFPFTEHEAVPMSTLTVLLTIVPLAIMLFATLMPAAIVTLRKKDGTRTAAWRHGLWEFHVNFLGLAMTLALTIFITEDLKIMFGKPRPDFLARCLPDLTNVSQFVVGGVKDQANDGQLVTRAICTQTDLHILNDGLKSFPSGHSSGAAAGFLYLSLFLAGKFGVLPMVSPRSSSDSTAYTFLSTSRPDTPTLGSPVAPPEPSPKPYGPPISLMFICLVPFIGAIFVAASRWFDFRHHPADIFFGFVMGMLIAILGYRFSRLHLGPPTRGGPDHNPKMWAAARGSMAEENIALNRI